MERWQDIRNVVVVGLGITGLSVVNHLQQIPHSLRIRVMDSRSQPPGADTLPQGIDLHCGSFEQQWLNEADLIVCNPGIALATPEIATAMALDIPVVGDIELFAWANTKPVIAITGSNGKSTVTDLTGELAKAAGLKVGVGGNIGVPALDLLQLDADLYVLELSSFQLETTSSLKTIASAFLNLSEDHMDRYQGMDDYALAKQRIFLHAENALVNRLEPGTYPDPERYTGHLHTFGFDNQAFGMQQQNGTTWLMDNGEPIVDASMLNIVGKHNWSNALVACALLKLAGVDYRRSSEALIQYSGLSHRCQVVAKENGVTWVNDSKATNVASTLAALSGLVLEGHLYLLLGGEGKGADFSALSDPLSQLNVSLCCFGRDGELFTSLHSSAQRFDTLDEVLAHITPTLKQGDMVMLSPACASFDQFANFMARGDHFSALAKQYSRQVS
ncbi:UDP-N-acetylmuramoyl-L-alanine--D-glutamate ligase [Vibrio sp. 10N.286.49.C2]|uniref:UDP-N-acetylmuramoyl-L-alanine--D-glutamate ligase n=1 Tax=unclassified Vibrio TaxID=2614977 RepID=UPI000C82D0B1|nr:MULTISPECIES: UDP-N-acetylmuramoyl-L-alanine--D-glutamate ligase [unclassified Vibrio]PMH29521.1 UDP-N-acetylmuramoyl-L-alanine--D-glutamate ligase [Vibrio sp. 10N.286.49.C2]PMH56036.1 UDP-N-acetylmuramoyl-L-alanine--D-glutamate ligase [Vibrio sp. 10N.286.49.B1]PMH83686.1 UDP-N-acetylmuramoyl-L-alanine--D-glutamate ligase [Vibrio sp. 10N.286.48.B7]